MEEQQTVAPEEAPKAKRAYKQRLSKTDAEKAITQLQVMHRYIKKDILTALKSKECNPGTNSRLAYLKALQQLEIDYVEQITKMGVLPKNVASQTQTQYIFKAHVGKGGSVQTTPVNTKQLHEIERAEARECRKGMADSPEDEAIRAQFEAQYGDGAVQEAKE
jgi:hypothetical protein